MIHPPLRTIVDVFESLPEGTLCQVINNQLIMSPAPTSQHQKISKHIFRQLDSFVEKNHLGEVFYGPIDVYLNEKNIYQPDIIFISKENLHIIQNKIKGVPDLIIEIPSKASEKIDKIEKKAVYEKNGVKEYWIVEPETKKIWSYGLEENVYKEIPSQNGLIQSKLLDVTIQF